MSKLNTPVKLPLAALQEGNNGSPTGSTSIKLNLAPKPTQLDTTATNAVARNKRLVPAKMLSVDTGIRSMLRREANTKSYMEQSNERQRKRMGEGLKTTNAAAGTTSPKQQSSSKQNGLPAISEMER